MDIFKKNLYALKQTNNQLANKIKKIQTNTKYEVFAIDKYSNANIYDTQKHIPIYLEQPQVEIDKKLSELEEYKLYPSLYFYGIGNGYLYFQLLKNKFHQRIYVIEPELDIIYIALNLFDFSTEIINRRIIILLSSDIVSGTFSLLFQEADKLYFKAYMLHIHSNFYENYLDDIKRINKEITAVFSYGINSAGNDIIDEMLGLEHFLENIDTLLKNPTLIELEKKAKLTDTVIIVATGPSLYKQLSLLKKIQNHVTIISVDASFPILEKEGIKPDIVTSIERVEATAKFYEKTSKEFQKDIIFAVTSIVDKKLLTNIKNGQIQMSMRPTGTYYRYMDIDDWGYLGLGMSSANMAYELASKIRFKTIVLIGQDLSYGKDGKSHSKNHIFGENEIKQTKQQDDYITAYGGNGTIKTTFVWKLFLNGFIREIEQNNRNGEILTINATEGGARIPGAKELAFSKVIEQYINTKTKKGKIILEKPSATVTMHNIEQIVDKLANIKIASSKIVNNAKNLLEEITYAIEQSRTENTTEEQTQIILNKISDIRDQYYNPTIHSFYGLLLQPYLIHIGYDIAYWSIQPENSKEERLYKSWYIIVLHKEWLSRMIVSIEKAIEIIESKYQKLEELVQIEEV